MPLPAARWREPSILPGFPLAFGLTLAYLGAIVIIPLAALVLKPWSLGLDGVWRELTEPRVLAALRLSFAATVREILEVLTSGLLARASR